MYFPLVASSRYGSWSPDAFQPRFCSWFPSYCNDPPEDKQEEHSLDDISEVVLWIHSIYGFPPAPLGSGKIHGFQVGLDSEDQSFSSYRLLACNTSADILVNIDDSVSVILRDVI